MPVVRVSARILSWPSICACCCGVADTEVPARYWGAEVERNRSWPVPYCTKCLHAYQARQDLRKAEEKDIQKLRDAEEEAVRDLREAEEQERKFRNDMERADEELARADAMDTSASSVMTIGLFISLLLGGFGFCCMSFLCSAMIQAIFRVNPDGGVYITFIMMPACGLALGGSCLVGFLLYRTVAIRNAQEIKTRCQRDAENRLADAQSNLSDVRSEVAELRAKVRQAREMLEAKEAVHTNSVETLAVQYLDWSGTVHTFEFTNGDYARAFLLANASKVVP